jgi:hypothetical protein
LSAAAPPTVAAGRPIIRSLPILFLCLAAGVVLLLQHPERLGVRDGVDAAWARAAQDDYDFTAMALRGVNAAAGRSPGRLDEPQRLGPEAFNSALDDRDQRVCDRYYLEYPHTALLLFRLGWVGRTAPGSPAVLDAAYHDVVDHAPRDDAERVWWSEFRGATRAYVVVMAVCGVALMLLLQAGYEPGGGLSSSALLLLLPAALYFTLNRFDVVPALATAAGLACLGRRWTSASAVCFGVAVMVKVYPVLLTPIILRYLWKEPRRAVRWAAVFGAAAAALVLPPLLAEGWEAVAAPYRVQLSRGPLLPELTAYGAILPESWSEKDSLAGRIIRLAGVLATAALLCLRRPPNLASVLRRCAVVLIVFIGLSNFFSPQWIFWLAPLLLPLASRDRLLVGLIVALDLVTYFTWPLRSPLLATDAVAVYVRFSVLAALLAILLWRDRRATAAVRLAT